MNKVYLDPTYLDSLERLGFEEGWLSEYSQELYEHKKVPNWHFYAQDTRNYYRSRTLQLVSLFESIDSYPSALNVSKLISEGVISPNSMMATDKKFSTIYTPTDNESEKLEQYANESARNLLTIFDNKIINLHIRDSWPGTYTRDPKRFVSKKDLEKEYAFVLGHIAEFGDMSLPDSKLHLSDFQNYLSGYYWGLQSCIFYSCMESSAFASPLESNTISGESVTDLIDDMYYFVRTKFDDEILILPQPRTLKEAVEIRNAKELKIFRQVLSQWCEVLLTGSKKLETRIRRDIRIANGDLKKLQKWREYERSPINFWLNAVGGQIPIFSNILSAIQTGMGLYSGWIENHKSWLLLVQKTTW